MRRWLLLLLTALVLTFSGSSANAGPKKKKTPTITPKKKGAAKKACAEAEVDTLGKGKKQTTTRVEYRYAGDTCGLVYWLGSQGRKASFANPALAGKLTVEASSLMQDSQPPSSLVGRKLVRLTTKPQKNSWFAIDFGRYKVAPTRYSLRHYSSWDAEAVRNWELQASNDGKHWTTLRKHANDATLTKKGQWGSWTISAAAGKKSWRYFRVLQTDRNSNAHYYLALSGFEVYGTLVDTGKVDAPASPGQFAYSYDFDENGIVHHLGEEVGGGTFTNPAAKYVVDVQASSVMHDSKPASELLARKTLRFSTKPQKNSWVRFDFKGRTIRPTAYTLRHYDTWDTEALRNWVLEASNDGTTWTTLRTHTNDTALNKKGATHTWTISGASKGYRMFRVRMTGKNSNAHDYLALSGFEIYGDLAGKATKPPQFAPVSDFDSNGIVHHLGTDGGKRKFENPANAGEMAVIASSVMTDSRAPTELVARKTLRFSSKPYQGSWIVFDFLDRKVRPSHYSLRHYNTWDTEALRSWVLEASNDQKTWTVLSEHENDAALDKKGKAATWSISAADPGKAYRYFRIRMTGKNSNNHYYLALSGFEIYGDLVE